MRPLTHLLAILALVALAAWAYREGYATRDTARAVEALREDIARAREDLAVLRAEWAYLNRPDRLAGLAAMNYERLQLVPLDAARFGSVEEVAFPPEAGALWAGLGPEGKLLHAVRPLASRPTAAPDVNGVSLP